MVINAASAVFVEESARPERMGLPLDEQRRVVGANHRGLDVEHREVVHATLVTTLATGESLGVEHGQATHLVVDFLVNRRHLVD